MNIILSLLVFLNLQEIVQRSDLDENMPRILCSIAWVESNHTHLFKKNQYYGMMQIHRDTSYHVWTQIVKNKTFNKLFKIIPRNLVRFIHYDKHFNILTSKFYLEWLFSNTKNIKTSIMKYNTGYWSKKVNLNYYYRVEQAYQKICKYNNYEWVKDINIDIRY